MTLSRLARNAPRRVSPFIPHPTPRYSFIPHPTPRYSTPRFYTPRFSTPRPNLTARLSVLQIKQPPAKIPARRNFSVGDKDADDDEMNWELRNLTLKSFFDHGKAEQAATALRGFRNPNLKTFKFAIDHFFELGEIELGLGFLQKMVSEFTVDKRDHQLHLQKAYSKSHKLKKYNYVQKIRGIASAEGIILQEPPAAKKKRNTASKTRRPRMLKRNNQVEELLNLPRDYDYLARPILNRARKVAKRRAQPKKK